jgi:protease-4
MFPTFQRTLERVGVHVDGVGTTALSGEFRADRPISEATRDILQTSIEHGYQQFIESVAAARKQDVAKIDAVAQGRVWSGADAKRLGLVDELGNSRDAIKLAAKLAKLGKDYDVVYEEVEPGIGEALGLRFRAAVAGVVAPLLPQDMLPVVPKALKPVVRSLQRLDRLADPRSIYAYCLVCSVD